MSSKQRVAAVLWDVDGTLSDSFQLGFGATKTVLERNGVASISDADYHAGTKFTTPRRLAWHVTGNPDDPVGASLGQQFDELYVGLVSRDTAPLYDGIPACLTALREQDPALQFAALSNACGAYVRAVMASNALGTLFPVQRGADEVAAAKPSGLGLLECCAELGADAGRCIYVGDSPSDAAAAQDAGFMCSVGVTWGSHSEESVRR